MARIKEMIYEGTLRPGEKLPPERDLARQMGVGRPTIREAIQHLEGVGLLEVRPLVGNFVRSLTAESLEAPLRRMLRDELRVVLQFVDIRMALEGWAAAEAAEYASAEQVARIQTLAEQLEDVAGRGEPLLQLELAFHQALLDASRNDVLRDMTETLTSMIKSVHALMNLLRWPEHGRQRTAHHRDIAEAIAARNPKLAQSAMVGHLRVLRGALTDADLLRGDEARPSATTRGSADA